MKGRIALRERDERGASLMLVIAFMVMMGAISAAVISTSSSGIQERVALDQTRNREYSADAGTETAIAAARAAGGFCPATPPSVTININTLNVHVDCKGEPIVILDGVVPKVQNNLLFTACIGTTTCGMLTTPTVINAQVNFQGTLPATITTKIQAWSVNG